MYVFLHSFKKDTLLQSASVYYTLWKTRTLTYLYIILFKDVRNGIPMTKMLE